MQRDEHGEENEGGLNHLYPERAGKESESPGYPAHPVNLSIVAKLGPSTIWANTMSRCLADAMG